MCWCTPNLRTPCCGRIDCVPPIKTTIGNSTEFKNSRNARVKPLIENLDKLISIHPYERLNWNNGVVTTFKYPECSYEMEILDNPLDLDTGSYLGISECKKCKVNFEGYNFKVEAFIKIRLESK